MTKTIFVATGKSFGASQWLKQVGFTFDGKTKEWTAEQYDTEQWKRFCSPSWNGRGNAAACDAVTIITREVEA